MTNTNLFTQLMDMEIPKISTTTGKYTFGLVNSKSNGKRMSFSKSLVEALDLTDSIMMMPHPTERKLVVGKTLPFPNAVTGKLSGDGKKICYLTSMVELLTTMFKIDFSKHVSKTFTDIEIDAYNGETVAIISFPQTTSNVPNGSVNDGQVGEAS